MNLLFDLILTKPVPITIKMKENSIYIFLFSVILRCIYSLKGLQQQKKTYYRTHKTSHKLATKKKALSLSAETFKEQ